MQSAAVALPQGIDQGRVLLRPLGMETLLELVQHDHNLWSRTTPQQREGLHQTEFVGEFGQLLSQSAQDARFCVIGSRLDVDRHDVLGQTRQQSGIDQ